ncbi:MAG: glycoside hydrolase family 3 N-terminal domain-containing protein [Elusimicrobiota bacterium]
MFTPSPFIFGIEGLRPSRTAIQLLKDTEAAGILLLPRNIRTPDQVRGLVSGLQDQLGRPLLVSIDHEGGWVLRFTQGITFFPGNAALARSGRPQIARDVGRRMARELAALGIGLNLAPVADVQGTRYNPGIGIRSFGSDTKIVSKFTKEFICGHLDHKVAACVKHFPGKGEAVVDAHADIPTINASRRAMTARHLPPFAAAIAAKVPCVMTTHAVYPALDPSGATATYSRPIAHDLLRRRLGFSGVLISDDLCMGAVIKHESVPQASVRALRAGHDLLIIAQAPHQRKSVLAVQSALDRGRLDAAQWRDSQRRIKHLLDRFVRPATGRILRPDIQLPRRLAAAAVTVLQRGTVPLPLNWTGRPIIDVYWPNLREISGQFTFEGGPDAPLRLLRDRLSRWPAHIRYNTVPLIRRRRGTGEARIKSPHLTLFFCFDALRYAAQKEALRHVQQTTDRLVVLLMRNPWDQTLLDRRVTALTAYGFRNSQILALAERLK